MLYIRFEYSTLHLARRKWKNENERIVETQAGFRRNSTTDQIFNLYAIAQKCLNKKGQKLYVAFVDLRKVFDSVHHDKLLQAVQQEGVKGILVFFLLFFLLLLLLLFCFYKIYVWFSVVLCQDK